MSTEKFCETHGPYDARYTSCPICQRVRNRPSQPAPLDEQATGGFSREPARDDAMTHPPSGRRAAASAAAEDETELPRRLRGSPMAEDDLDETQVDRAATGLLGWLIVKDGMRRGTVHRIGHGVTLGRRGADVVIQDAKVSKLHAKFAIEGEGFVIADMLSENGTYVNGARISQITPLQENDWVRVGDTILVLKTLLP